jgi:hypothetical protein
MPNRVTNTVHNSQRNLPKVNCNRRKKLTHLDIKFSRLVRIGLFAAFNILLIIAETASRIKNLQKIIFFFKNYTLARDLSHFVASVTRLDIRKGVFRAIRRCPFSTMSAAQKTQDFNFLGVSFISFFCVKKQVYRFRVLKLI